MRVDMCKKLEETMHLHGGNLCQDSTFDLFQFLSIFFIQNLSCETRGAALICECGLYAGVYGMPVLL